jgi:hypothetical protein
MSDINESIEGQLCTNVYVKYMSYMCMLSLESGIEYMFNLFKKASGFEAT